MLTVRGGLIVTGTTISLSERLSQAMWPGKACTSSTIWVCFVAAAAPHTPRPKAMRRQPSVPWYGPTTSSSARSGATTASDGLAREIEKARSERAYWALQRQFLPPGAEPRRTLRRRRPVEVKDV